MRCLAKRRTGVICILLICGTLLLSGCFAAGSSDRRYKGTEEEMMEQVIDDFVTAMDANDADAIKGMLSPNVQASDGIDALIQELLDFYPGQIEKIVWNGNVGAYYSKGEDHRFHQCSTNFDIFSEGNAYYCQLELRYGDMDEGGIGVRRITLATEEAVCDEAFSWIQESGIFLFNDTDGDYLTRRIGGRPFIYTPMERVITEEEILDFIVDNNIFDDFTDAFGAPNGDRSLMLFPVYELTWEDGEPRYAMLWLDYDQEAEIWCIDCVQIMSPEEELYYLWRADGEY